MLRRGILALVAAVIVLLAMPSTTAPIPRKPAPMPEVQRKDKHLGSPVRIPRTRCYVIAADPKLKMLVSICLSALPLPEIPQPDPES